MMVNNFYNAIGGHHYALSFNEIYHKSSDMSVVPQTDTLLPLCAAPECSITSAIDRLSRFV